MDIFTDLVNKISLSESIEAAFVAILTVCMPSFVQMSFRTIQNEKLIAINRFLMCGYNSWHNLTIHAPVFFWTKMISIFFSVLAVVSIIFNWVIWWEWYIAAFVGWSIYALICSIYRNDVKGLVGIITHKVRDVENVAVKSGNEIFLATHYIVDGHPESGVYSYEKRTPILDSIKIANLRDNIIIRHYTKLKARIDREANNSSLFFVEISDKNSCKKSIHICDFMTEHAYSLSSLMDSIKTVSDRTLTDNSINFIGDKIGIEGFTIKNGLLTLDIYKTDHFTFKVFKEIFKRRENKETFQVIMRRLNRASMSDKALLVASLKFLFSSFGLDIIVHGRKANGHKGVLLGIRNGCIENHGQSKIHVAVNESFSLTDMEEDDKFSLKKCAVRGVEEELGIPLTMMNNADLLFRDFAVVSDEGEIGLGCDINISEIMPLEEAMLYPGQDKFLEMKELLLFDFPPFKWDPNKYRDYFYSKSNNSLLTTPWESFTPLLYQRLALREVHLNDLTVNTISFSILAAIIWIVSNTLKTIDYNYLFEFIGFAVGAIFLFIHRCFIKRESWKKYHLYKPLIPQWDGDARGLQSLKTNLGDPYGHSEIERNPVMTNMMFGLNNVDRTNLKSFHLKDLHITSKPWCAVRHELTKNHAESPINFYLAQPANNNLAKNRMYILEVPISYSSGKLQVYMRYEISKQSKYYKFTCLIPDVDIVFDHSFSKQEIECYSRFFKLPADMLNDLPIGHFDKDFCNKYTLLDLFGYRDCYYWSVMRKHDTEKDSIIHEIDGNTNIYDKFIKNTIIDEGCIEFIFQGEPNDIIKAISRFIDHPTNRTRINSLDIYILQLALARLGSDKQSFILALKK